MIAAAAADGIMPGWAQILLGAAAVITALGVLWTKVLKPGALLISTTEEMLPLLRELTVTFRGTPESFKILSQIIAEFRSDSGSTLRDVVNRLEIAAIENRRLLDQAAAEMRASDQALKVGVETTRQLADQDRETQRRLMLLVDRLSVKLDELVADRAKVAENLTTREEKVDRASADVAEELAARKLHLDSGTEVVAADLAAGQQRADENIGPHGAAADAALMSPSDERRQIRQDAEDARRAKWDESHAKDAEGTDEAPSTGATPTGGEEG